jgi:hypothetical protein
MSIPKLISRVCVQPAVYWGSPQNDGRGGRTYADPVEIYVRWDDEAKLIVDDRGQEIVSRAEVLVQQDLDLDGRLLLGSLSDLAQAERDDPMAAGAWRIKRRDKNPLFASRNKFVRVVYL